jgi:hypothetical protein
MRLKYVGQSHFPDHTKDIARGEEALFFFQAVSSPTTISGGQPHGYFCISLEPKVSKASSKVQKVCNRQSYVG